MDVFKKWLNPKNQKWPKNSAKIHTHPLNNSKPFLFYKIFCKVNPLRVKKLIKDSLNFSTSDRHIGSAEMIFNAYLGMIFTDK